MQGGRTVLSATQKRSRRDARVPLYIRLAMMNPPMPMAMLAMPIIQVVFSHEHGFDVSDVSGIWLCSV